jgi:hypothetical protein
MKKTTLLAMAFVLLQSATAYAWGPKGHALVGQIAWHFLSQSGRQNVQKYLGDMPVDVAANWMDSMRSNYEYDFMKPWHFVNFEKGAAYSPTPEENILNRITYSFNELQHKQLLCSDQVNFDILVLMHLVGDIHQPLHAGYGDDKGGNARQVEYLGSVKTNLHHIWDENLVDRPGVTLESILQLQQQLTTAQLPNPKSFKFTDWMNESRSLADVAYDFPDYRLDEAYAQKGEAIVKTRLLYAGIRLAAMLDKLFATVEVAVAPPWPKSITAQDAINHIDKNVTVCSKVYGVKATGKVTFINVGARFPNSPLTLVIFEKDRANFKGSLEDLYADKNICVRGKVVEYKGKAEIIITQPEEITVMDRPVEAKHL